jgi:hypothetical protein
MPVTRFPYGIDVGDGSGGATASYAVGHVSSNVKLAHGTVVVPVGGTTIATGLSTVAYVSHAAYGTIGSTLFISTMGTIAGGGSITLHGVSAAGTASGASGTATWLAFGT